MSSPRLLTRRFNRRQFLRDSTATAAATLANPFGFLHTHLLANQTVCGTRGPSPYGPLVPVQDQATGLYLIMLPSGFTYTTLSWAGDTLDDGNPVPTGHDGMAVLDMRGRGITAEHLLIRNQEVFGLGQPIAPEYNYDSQGPGGTTVLRIRNGRLLEHVVSISGTSGNCAGGPTPWGTWLTCEERMTVGNELHGYVFESTLSRVTTPTPLRHMGRFKHEAVAVDPKTGGVYLTEDNSSNNTAPESRSRMRGNSGFYYFDPDDALGGLGSLNKGGTLYMLQALMPGTDAVVEDLRDPECLSKYDVKWVKIADPDADPTDTMSGPYLEGREGGATRFQRLEGCWWNAREDRVVFVDTEAGPVSAQPGQHDRAEGAVWSYDPRNACLTNLFVSRGAEATSIYGSDNPDNITVSPQGGIILCEDGGQDDGNGLALLGLLPNGQTFEFARNIIEIDNGDQATLAATGHNPDVIETGNYSGREWAGATFSPDGRWLFANIQSPGITFCINGPWSQGPF